jgi:hypothetical protein
LSLQDHGNPVRYRNIWLRKLPDGTAEEGISLPLDVLDRYVGVYNTAEGAVYRLRREGQRICPSWLRSAPSAFSTYCQVLRGPRSPGLVRTASPPPRYTNL